MDIEKIIKEKVIEAIKELYGQAVEENWSRSKLPAKILPEIKRSLSFLFYASAKKVPNKPRTSSEAGWLKT
jgi:hypothetical protein